MFFEHRQGSLDQNKKVSIKNATLISDFSEEIIKQRFESIKKLSNGGDEVNSVVITKTQVVKNDEEYEVEITPNKITIKSPKLAGALYALADLKDMSVNGGILQGKYIENTALPFRAYRVYLPSRETTDIFCKDILELLLDLKYNTVILEVGGAMEYKRHPKINEKWREFALDMQQYSGRTNEIERGFPWEKNSIHVENADGEILTQEEVKNIVDIYKASGFNVVPEVPTYSHSDYICMAYPQYAENKKDPYPDTYCPSEPEVYKIVFDILDEVISVFNPTMVNIGHDELYSMCLCDKCKDKDPVELYVSDITKIYTYLKERGIKTCMWGEKLLDARSPSGIKQGGAGLDYVNEHGYYITAPALYNCRYYIPKDILLFNWYWVWDFKKDFDLVYTDNGYDFAYGNFTACSKGEIDWGLSLQRGIKGVVTSNWGSFQEEYMQGNVQIFSLYTCAIASWDTNYRTENRLKEIERIAPIIYNNKKMAKNADIEIIHTTKDNRARYAFYCGVFIDEKLTLGHYEFTFESGKKAKFDVTYYINIAGDKNELGSDEFISIIGFTLPIIRDGRTYYKTFFKNPYGEKVVDVKFIKKDENYPYDIEFELVKG